jgi:hypothetical protein
MGGFPRRGSTRESFDKTKGFPGEGPRKYGTNVMTIVGANCTAWRSMQKAIEDGEFHQEAMICLSEHKLNTKEKVAEAQAWAKHKGWRFFAPVAKTTDKKAASAGVGFMWRPWLNVSNIGKLQSCDETRWTSCQLEMRNTGPMNVIVLYGSDKCIQYTQRMLEDIRMQVQATGMPTIIVGDFNWDADECREWLKHTKWQMWVQDFGKTCTTSDSVSAIDYMLVSPQIRGAMVSSESMNSQLATHRPIRVGFAVKRDQKMRVFEAPTKARPRNTPVIGLQLEDATN